MPDEAPGRSPTASPAPDLDTWEGMGDRAKRRRARPPTARSQATEQRIHRAAAEIFRQKGYASTSLQDIADAVGMLKSSLYYYIDGKEDLLFAISQHIMGIGRANLERSLHREGTAEERIVGFLTDHVTSFAEAIDWQRVFHAEYHELSGDRYEEVLRRRGDYEQHLCDLIDRSRVAGNVCPDLDTWLMMTMIFSMLNSIYNWYRPGGRLSLAAVTRNCTQATLGALACPPGHEHRAAQVRLARRATPAPSPRPRSVRRTPS